MEPRVNGRGEELFIGIVGVALLPMIAWRIHRGLTEGRLPIYRTYLTRQQNGAKFQVLLALHALSFIVMAVIAADMLFELRLKEAL
jgi:hypothetical protein